jgi:putative flippase GtrA
MAAGTLVALVVKYVLDKRWIFKDYETGVSQHARKLLLYSLMGSIQQHCFGQRSLSLLTWARVRSGVTWELRWYCLDRRFLFFKTA